MYHSTGLNLYWKFLQEFKIDSMCCYERLNSDYNRIFSVNQAGGFRLPAMWSANQDLEEPDEADEEKGTEESTG